MVFIISNVVKKIDTSTVKVPLIVRSDQEGWVPAFDLWETAITQDISLIDCSQNFRTKIKEYDISNLNPEIGHYDKNLIIYWKALVNSEDLKRVNEIYSGKLRATSWKKRYCTYFGTGSNKPWLHSVILGTDKEKYVVHHINGVSVDNRRMNLHQLPKKEHDSIDHPNLAERKKMFSDPDAYWKTRKELAVQKFITQLGLIITDEYKADFIAQFAQENPLLAKEVLEAARYYINLSHLKEKETLNRKLNQHLSKDYLDAYEIEKYLQSNLPKTKLASNNQLRLF